MMIQWPGAVIIRIERLLVAEDVAPVGRPRAVVLETSAKVNESNTVRKGGLV